MTFVVKFEQQNITCKNTSSPSLLYLWLSLCCQNPPEATFWMSPHIQPPGSSEQLVKQKGCPKINLQRSPNSEYQVRNQVRLLPSTIYLIFFLSIFDHRPSENILAVKFLEHLGNMTHPSGQSIKIEQ